MYIVIQQAGAFRMQACLQIKTINFKNTQVALNPRNLLIDLN